MSSPSQSTESDPRSLSARIQFLQCANSYPEFTRHVTTVETHLSWVFLTDLYAYKLKKPVHTDFADFSTVEARRENCLEEVRLNRRLARDVYLGAVALSVNGTRHLQWGTEGDVVEWLVHMRRLPAERMLDQAIERASIDWACVDEAALALSAFYLQAPRLPVSLEQYTIQLREDADANFRALSCDSGLLPQGVITSVHHAQQAFLAQNTEVLGPRTTHIVEGHGDLRPEHICLLHPPAIIDCLEFKRRFRLLDCAEELAFLWMECEQLGAAEVGERVLAVYTRITGDHPPMRLMDFYMSHRASLRAKLSIWHLRDAPTADNSKWTSRALRYLELAQRHSIASLSYT